METPDTITAALADLSSEQYDHILLDFDHTLLLDNSTERFLDSLHPRLLAFLLVAAGDWMMRALAWFGLCRYNDQRDFVRVLLCTLFMPWNHFLWPATVRRLARNSMNRALLEALPPDTPVVVLSYGFRHIIQPILDAAGLQKATLVCSQTGPRFKNLRPAGKLDALAQHAPGCDLSRTLFVTDSHDDDAVAGAVAKTHFIQWGPYAPPAFEHCYVPMRYTVEGKYANSRYFTYQILLEDFALLLLAYALSPWDALGLWFLFVSLYAIYEIGYYENDHVAAAREDKPVVSDAARAVGSHPRFKPWVWAVLCALASIMLVRQPSPDILTMANLRHVIMWVGVLAGVRGTFFVFNRLHPLRRVFVFPVLHLFKTFSFMLLVPLTFVGLLVLAAQVASISLNYMVYRFGGNLDRFNRQLWRLLLFGALVAAACVITPTFITETSPIRFGLILVWCAIRTVERARRRTLPGILMDMVRPNRP